jgi:serine/threonine-protein kinase
MSLPVLTRVLAVALLLPTLASAQSFGAIAYSPPTGQWGWSNNYADQASAEARALAECQGAAGHGCQGAVWFSNACGALAVGPRGWGTGWGDTVARAHAEAVGVCSQYSEGCAVQMDVCSP